VVLFKTVISTVLRRWSASRGSRQAASTSAMLCRSSTFGLRTIATSCCLEPEVLLKPTRGLAKERVADPGNHDHDGVAVNPRASAATVVNDIVFPLCTYPSTSPVVGSAGPCGRDALTEDACRFCGRYAHRSPRSEIQVCDKLAHFSTL